MIFRQQNVKDMSDYFASRKGRHSLTTVSAKRVYQSLVRTLRTFEQNDCFLMKMCMSIHQLKKEESRNAPFTENKQPNQTVT